MSATRAGETPAAHADRMSATHAAWSHRVNATVQIPPPAGEPALAVATMFGLEQPAPESLYRDFDLTVRPGQIIAVVGPSGAGKSVLLREVCKAHPCARKLRTAELSRDRRPAVAALEGGTLMARLSVLSRCGLADAGALVRPARNLSGGQLYRLALAEALHRSARARRPALVVADEFAASLDDRTAEILCRQMRKLIGPDSRLTLMIATPRAALLEALAPDVVIVKPLSEPARIVESGRTNRDSGFGLRDSGRNGKTKRDSGFGLRDSGRNGKTKRDSGFGLRDSGRNGEDGFREEVVENCEDIDRRLLVSSSPKPESRNPIPAQSLRVERGTIQDYRALAKFHYLAGPPAAHKRVYVIRGEDVGRGSLAVGRNGEEPLRCYCQRPADHGLLSAPPVAAVLVVSPPVRNVRGRNLVFGQRYTGRARKGDRHRFQTAKSEPVPFSLRGYRPRSTAHGPRSPRARLRLAAKRTDAPLAPGSSSRRRLNTELECISRVVVHPTYRGAGLAVKLVRHALADRRTRYMESLAAMGAMHPLFELAGMTAVHLPPDRHLARLVSAAQAVGIDQRRLAAVEPVRRLLQKGDARARFLQREIDLCLRRTMDPKRLARTPDPVATVCRRTARQYVYYVSCGTPKSSWGCLSSPLKK